MERKKEKIESFTKNSWMFILFFLKAIKIIKNFPHTIYIHTYIHNLLTWFKQLHNFISKRLNASPHCRYCYYHHGSTVL